jgi:hypothetical protein
MRTATRSPAPLFAVTKSFTVGALRPDPGIFVLTSYKCRCSALARTPRTRRHKLNTLDYSSLGHLITPTNEADLKIVEVAIIGELGENQLNCLTVVHNRPFFRNVEVTNSITVFLKRSEELMNVTIKLACIKALNNAKARVATHSPSSPIRLQLSQHRTEKLEAIIVVRGG